MCLVDLYVFVGAWGGPGLTGRSFQKSTLFSHRFWDGFLMVSASILNDFFDVFPMFFASLFDTFFSCFFEDVSHFFDFLLFGRTLADTHSTAAR